MSNLAVSPRSVTASRCILVWELPVRLFHWSLVALMITLFVTAKLLDDAIETHALAGYGVLTLMLFRLLWGFVGGPYARFRSFVRGPRAGLRYARSLLGSKPVFVVGHNPLGGWMVVALLAGLLTQAALGLFTTDEILFDGPLRHLVSSDAAGLMTGLHVDLFWILLGLVALHVAAIVFHKIRNGENLTLAMLSGYKEVPLEIEAERGRGGNPAVAALLFAACAAVVYLIVK